MKNGIIALFAFMMLASCGVSGGGGNSTSTTERSITGDGVIEVLYLHGKQRCATCNAIQTQAVELIEELNLDSVVMRVIDFSTPQGEKIADMYEVASSSLLIVKDGRVKNLTSTSFQYARNNPEQFKKNLSEAIQKIQE